MNEITTFFFFFFTVLQNFRKERFIEQFFKSRFHVTLDTDHHMLCHDLLAMPVYTPSPLPPPPSLRCNQRSLVRPCCLPVRLNGPVVCIYVSACVHRYI